MDNKHPMERVRHVTYRPKNVGVDNCPPNNLHVGLRSGLEFINGLPFNIRVATRQGVVFTISPEHRASTRDFQIRQSQEWGGRTDYDLSQLELARTAEAKAVIDSMLVNLAGMMGSRRCGSVTTNITSLDLETHGGTLYLEDLDVVISTEPRGQLIHPYSAAGRDLAQIGDTQGVDAENAASFIIRIIDNNRRIGNQFINLAGSIHRIPARVNPDMEDGIYVVRAGATEGDFPPGPPSVIRYDFEEGKTQLKLFDNVASARVHGDQETADKQQYTREIQKLRNEEIEHKRAASESASKLREKEHELELTKHELKKRDLELEDLKSHNAILKARYEEVSMRRKDTSEQLNAEYNERSIRRKDYYEERSADRRDTGEMLKWLPLVIVGVGAVFMALSGKGSSKFRLF